MIQIIVGIMFAVFLAIYTVLFFLTSTDSIYLSVNSDNFKKFSQMYKLNAKDPVHYAKIAKQMKREMKPGRSFTNFISIAIVYIISVGSYMFFFFDLSIFLWLTLSLFFFFFIFGFVTFSSKKLTFQVFKWIGIIALILIIMTSIYLFLSFIIPVILSFILQLHWHLILLFISLIIFLLCNFFLNLEYKKDWQKRNDGFNAFLGLTAIASLIYMVGYGLVFFIFWLSGFFS